jgi:hypothetical protein
MSWDAILDRACTGICLYRNTTHRRIMNPMEPHRRLMSVAAIVFGALCTTGHPGRAQEPRAEAGVAEIYTRGPMHEAFAAAVALDPVPGLIVDAPPPPDVEEVVPAQCPVGGEVAWIPGYWVWDEELGDFLWVSGIWRNPPPGRQWVPAEWVDIGNRYQWT